MPNLQIEKFYPPALHDKIIDRPSLVKKLDTMASQNIPFIHAPAGYGKTTLALLLVNSSKYPYAWLSLDKSDSDIQTFCLNFLSALSVCTNDNSLIDEAANNPRFASSPIECTLNLLFRWNPPKETLSIVIDNFNPSEHSYAAKHFHVLKKHLPIKTKLIIISRTPPPSEMYDLIVKRRLSIVNLNDLRFTKQETKALFKKYHILLSDFALDDLEKSTAGWAAIIMSVIISCYNPHSGVIEIADLIQTKPPNDYLINQIYDIWNKNGKDILLKTSLFDFIEPSFCKMITHKDDCFDVLLHLHENTGFLLRNKNGTYVYHPIFKSFLLSELAKDKTIQKEKLYLDTAAWLLDCKKSLPALDMAIKSGNIEITEKTLIAICNSQNFNVGIEELNVLIETVLLKHITDEIIKKTPILAMKCAWQCFITGKLNELDNRLVHIKEMLQIGKINQASEIATALLIISLRCKSVWDIIRLFEDSIDLFDAAPSNRAEAAVSLTHNLPFFHKGQHDYSEISPCVHKFLRKANPFLSPVFGKVYPLLEQLLVCGLLYEKNDAEGAYKIILSLQPIINNAPAEVLFCFNILACEILFLQDKPRFAMQTLQKIDNLIIDRDCKYLLPNLNAYKTKLSLYNGDTDTVLFWLQNYSVDIDANLRFHQIFQNLVTARALIVAGQLDNAIKFINKLLKFSIDYNRNIDKVEILTLRSACLWHNGDKNNAVLDIEEAIIIAYKSEIINPIIAEGKDILPILEYSLNRMRLQLCNPELNKEFLMRLYLLSTETAKTGKGLFANIKPKPVRLSKKQLQTLILLSQNLTYEQIATQTGVKITTVRDHISKLYEKLSVNNSKDALIKGRALKLI